MDFASPKAADHLMDFCAEKKLGLVLCTTGLSEAQIKKVKETAEKTAVLRSANMSLGVNLLLKLVQDAAKVLAGAGFDIEIVEKHHNQKVDAPSGTALALADSMNQPWTGSMPIPVTGVPDGKREIPKKSESRLSEEVPLWASTT